MEEKNLPALVEGVNIRKIWHNEEWYFSVIDVISALTDSNDPQQYWKRLNQRDKELKGGVQIVPLLFETAGGKQKIICSNTEGVFRIVMSVPSLKAEPIKLWLAEQGKRTIDETENPELLTQRQIDLYKAKGYTEEWIKERVQSIETRKRLTDEWKSRDVKEGSEYSILTATIAKGTFGLTPTEHKDLKNLSKPSQNLRDHMTPLELIFTSLSEEVTRRMAINDDAKGFNENYDTAVRGGKTAGEARKRVEASMGEKVVSSENFLNLLNTPNQESLPQSEDVKND